MHLLTGLQCLSYFTKVDQILNALIELCGPTFDSLGRLSFGKQLKNARKDDTWYNIVGKETKNTHRKLRRY